MSNHILDFWLWENDLRYALIHVSKSMVMGHRDHIDHMWDTKIPEVHVISQRFDRSHMEYKDS